MLIEKNDDLKSTMWFLNDTSNIVPLSLTGDQKNKPRRPQLYQSRSAEKSLYYIVILSAVKFLVYRFERKLYWSLIDAQKVKLYSLLDTL